MTAAPGRVVAVIPARGGSKRLERKNLRPVLGRPMLEWVIDACRTSRFVTQIYVSTENPEIARTAAALGVEVLPRPAALAADDVPKQEAIRDAVRQLMGRAQGDYSLVIAVQPNSPELTGDMLDAAIQKLLDNDLWEVFSVDARLIQNGAFRVMLPHVVFQTMPSVHCGVVVTDMIDIHTGLDLALAEQRLRARPMSAAAARPAS